MKKIISVVLLALTFSFGPDHANAQTTTVGVSCEITKFNFHRKKFDCGSGFGICLELDCKPFVRVTPWTGWSNAEPVPENEEPTLAGVFDLTPEGSTITLRILRNLDEDPSFAGEDLSIFTIDEVESEENIFELDEELQEALGYHHFRILPKEYAVEQGDFEGIFRKVVMDIEIID